MADVSFEPRIPCDRKTKCVLQPVAEIRSMAATTKSPLTQRAFVQLCHFPENLGAGEGARTLDPDLGKVVLYH